MTSTTSQSMFNPQTMSYNQSKKAWSAGLIYMEQDSSGNSSLHISPLIKRQPIIYETIDDIIYYEDDAQFWNQFPEPDLDDPIIGQFWSSIISRN